LHFTETTILSVTREKRNDAWGATSPELEGAQAEQAANFYMLLFAHPAVQAATWWDFSDYQAWQEAPAGLLRKDMSAKPAYDLLLKLIRHQWWTRTEGVTDAQGKVELRAFYGDYRVSAEVPENHKTSAETRVLRGQAEPIILKI